MRTNKSLNFFVFILFIVLPWLVSGQALYAPWVRVAAVIDGDTIHLANGVRVRYLGINAPEKEGKGPAEFLAQEAAQFNRRLVLHKEVRLEYGPERQDRFNRLLAYVFLDNGQFVNGEMVKKGLAHVLYHGLGMERFDELLQLQREAIQDSRGIWARVLRESNGGYRGLRKTRRFHRLDCSFGQAIAPENLIWFPSKKEAYWQGYSPCHNCKP